MPRHLLILAVAATASLGNACAEPVAVNDLPPDDYQLPPPDTSLDPARLSVGAYLATPCAFGIHGDRLVDLRSQHEWRTVDIFFGRSTSEGPWDRPLPSDVDHVRSYGGRVLYHFNVPAVRARMFVSRIPALVREGYWITVREVPDDTRYDVEPVSVGFSRPLDHAHVELYESLGGRVAYQWDGIRALSGVLPDRSISVLREQSDAEYVHGGGGVACLQ